MKNKTSIYLFLAIFLMLLISCKDDELAPRTIDDMRNDFANLTINTGINDISIESLNEGYFFEMRIIVPASASATNKVPLIISLHGGATIVSELYKDTVCLLEPGFEQMDAILISPNSKGKVWYDGINQQQVVAIVDLAKRSLPVDLSKVAITGYSDGGQGSWYYAQYYPNLFSASIPMAAMYNTANSSGVVSAISIPMYVVHGTADQLFNFDTSFGFVQESIDAGSNIIFVPATDLEHYNYCAYVPYLIDGVTWLEDTVWN